MDKQPIPTEPRPLPDGPLYFVGIGGAGQSAIAYVLAQRGRTIRGADPGISATDRARLESVGITVYPAHDPAQVGDAAAVIATDAVNETNPEIVEARKRNIPVFRRPEALGAILNAGRGIAISGTHGKTTTTGMVASILLAAGLDPTILIGGDLPLIGGNARNGNGDIVLAEACEAYDGFLYLHPEIVVITNIEPDHLDYHKTADNYFASFKSFVLQRKEGGSLITCGEDRQAQFVNNAGHYHSSDPDLEKIYNYGILLHQRIHVRGLDLEGPSPRFTVRWHVSEESAAEFGPVRLNVPGKHNVLNALAAAGVGIALGIAPEHIVTGLEGFTGTGRRFERVGEANGILIVDDYAHHPTEIRATLAAARSAYPGRRLVAIFQPHLYSRTRDFMDDFADSLTAADVVYLTDIYKAREQPIPGVSSQILAEKTGAVRPDLSVAYVADKGDLPELLLAEVRSGDLVLTMGAGDVWTVGKELFQRLNNDK